MPVDRHDTVDPSPIDHDTPATDPVADTEKPPSDAVRVIGPHVCTPGSATHNHTGNPTKPTDPGGGSGTIPTPTARNSIDATARRANTAGSGGAAPGAAASQSGGRSGLPGTKQRKISPVVRPSQTGSDFDG